MGVVSIDREILLSQLSTVEQLGTASNSVERSSVMVCWKFAEISYHVELKWGRCQLRLRNPELMTMSTVEHLGTASNSVERSNVIV